MAARPNPLLEPLNLTPEAVRGIFQSDILRRDRPPPLPACKRIADVMNDRNRVFLLMNGPLPVLREDDAAAKTFKVAAQSLRAALANLKHAYAARLGEYSDHAKEVFQAYGAKITPGRPWEQAPFDSLETTLSCVEDYVASRILPENLVLDWFLEVSLLGVLFDEAMEAANPGKQFGNASDGPRLRFIRAGLKLIAGIEMTEAAIKIRLARNEVDRNN